MREAKPDTEAELTQVDARKKALDLLSRREHSAREVREKLRLRGYDSNIIEPVVEYLESNDYLSDSRYAESFVRLRVEKGYGEQAIRARLREKGIHSALIATALKAFEAEWDSDWYAHAEATAERKVRQSGINSDLAGRQKIARFLQSRGFTADQTRNALGQLNV